MTGYGGFNIARTPCYTPMAVAWVEAGGVYALANLRGGSEEGRGLLWVTPANCEARRTAHLPF